MAQQELAVRQQRRISYIHFIIRLNSRRSCAPLYRAVRIALYAHRTGGLARWQTRSVAGNCHSASEARPGPRPPGRPVVFPGALRRTAAAPAGRGRRRTLRGGYSEAGAPEAEAPQGSQRRSMGRAAKPEPATAERQVSISEEDEITDWPCTTTEPLVGGQRRPARGQSAPARSQAGPVSTLPSAGPYPAKKPKQPRRPRPGSRPEDLAHVRSCSSGSSPGCWPSWPSGTSAAPRRPAARAAQLHAARPSGPAATWLAQQVSRDATVACDRVMCAALTARGFPSRDLLVLGPASEVPSAPPRSWSRRRPSWPVRQQPRHRLGAGRPRVLRLRPRPRHRPGDRPERSRRVPGQAQRRPGRPEDRRGRAAQRLADLGPAAGQRAAHRGRRSTRGCCWRWPPWPGSSRSASCSSGTHGPGASARPPAALRRPGRERSGRVTSPPPRTSGPSAPT